MIKFYDNDPKKGCKQISFWEHMQWMGIETIPIHDYELLKSTRQQQFAKERERFIEERKLKKVKTSDFELNCFYFAWLKDELEEIGQCLSDKTSDGKTKRKPSTSDQIEILKYQQFVTDEIENT